MLTGVAVSMAVANAATILSELGLDLLQLPTAGDASRPYWKALLNLGNSSSATRHVGRGHRRACARRATSGPTKAVAQQSFCRYRSPASHAEHRAQCVSTYRTRKDLDAAPTSVLGDKRAAISRRQLSDLYDAYGCQAVRAKAQGAGHQRNRLYSHHVTESAVVPSTTSVE